MSDQARVISLSELNRGSAIALQRPAEERHQPVPQHRVEANPRQAVAAARRGQAASASVTPSPQDGSSPLAISCRVTATAYRSAAASYSRPPFGAEERVEIVRRCRRRSLGWQCQPARSRRAPAGGPSW